MLKRVASILWRVINTSRKVIVNLVFFTALIVFIVALNQDDGKVVVPQKSALVLNLRGDIVEQKFEIDPVDGFINEMSDQQQSNPEILLANLVKVINKAERDDRIEMIVLKLDALGRGGLTKLKDVAKALEQFKSSGKKVIAVADTYSQDQYYLASTADKIWLNPKGWFLLEGYGRYQLYFKSALEKLSINQHIFRVGTYKSAVEPYLRDDMSDAAKEANKLWLDDLWQQYKQDVAKQRGIDVGQFDENIEALLAKLSESDGNVAEYALNNNWVDELKTREQIRDELIAMVGKNKRGNSFNQISYKDYLQAITPPIEQVNPLTDKVAVVVAKGTILNGTQKPGNIGGDSTAKLLRKARFNPDVKAVVLRVDSPGGSAYASEIIRQEVELLKQAGKPVIASMGSLAASGGYWISASANKIIASPSTITGSIGIFGLFMTFEDSLGKLGVYSDGVGTTDLSGFSLARPLNEGVGRLIQMNIDRGYQDFISLVAQSRNMSLEDVDAVAQGRVWSGAKALELGLVDELGDFDSAVTAAAELAGLEQYDTLLVEKELSARDKFLRNLFGQATTYLAPALNSGGPVTTGPVDQVIKTMRAEINKLNSFNDPQGVYSFCIACQQ